MTMITAGRNVVLLCSRLKINDKFYFYKLFYFYISFEYLLFRRANNASYIFLKPIKNLHKYFYLQKKNILFIFVYTFHLKISYKNFFHQFILLSFSGFFLWVVYHSFLLWQQFLYNKINTIRTTNKTFKFYRSC